MCGLATGSCIDLPLIIIRVIYWRLRTKINLRPLEDSDEAAPAAPLNLSYTKNKGGWEGLNK